MKFLYLYILLSSVLISQTLDDLNRLSNRQLDDLRNKLISENVDSTSIKSVGSSDLAISKVEISVDEKPKSSNPAFFGYNYFENNINFYDNIPTPSNYKLGPGDEIILSLWGETNLRETFVINKEGLIYFKNIGFINLSNKTLDEAKEVLVVELSKVFSTLNNDINPTKLMIELGRLKSLNVYFTGHIKTPGINLVHPFSDVFSAIVQAGGIQYSGSLRNIKIIREGNEELSVDFYDFFINGKNNFANFKLLDGDIIHIPPALNRVTISGEIISRGKYELNDKETVLDLVNYAGGLSSLAANSALFTDINQSPDRLHDDFAISTKNIFFNDFNKIELTNGDKIEIFSISNVTSTVTVYGMVKTPGIFSSFSDLKEVLDLAGGFNDPYFRKKILEDEIIVLRKDPNNYYAISNYISYNNSKGFKLEPDDKIFVYENINQKNSLTYNIEGEVNKPGTFPFEENISLGDAVKKAGGFSTLASEQNISLNQGEGVIKNLDLKFKFQPGSTINVPSYINTVEVVGNVYSPGLLAHYNNLSFRSAIELAGGYKPNSLRQKVYIQRANGEIDKVGPFLRGLGKRLDPGDKIFVPVDENPNDFDITRFVADLSSTLANIAAILLIIDNNSN